MELSCIICSSNKSIGLHAHRDDKDRIVGMVCLCQYHSDNLIKSTITINYMIKSKHEIKLISKLLPIKVDNF